MNMDFTLKKPCDDCPFLREGGIRLTQARVIEISGLMLHSRGGTFACHKTTRSDDDCDDIEDEVCIPGPDELHCAGALIFAEKNQNATQMMRICERIGLYDAEALLADKSVVDRVFDTQEEMLAVNADELPL